MTDWTARELTIDLSFLEEGSYEASICEDGVNADRYPSDYKLSTIQVSGTNTIKVKMAPGGGYIMRLKKKN